MATLVQLEANAKPDCVPDLIEFLKQKLPETRAYGGCQEITAYLDEVDHTFVYIELWDSKGHYENYLEWRKETGVFDEMAAMLQDEPSIRFFEPVEA